jgi:hypothetical protein
MITADKNEKHATIDAPIPRLLFAREPGWHFSLMLALEIVFLFGALPALSAGEADRSLINVLQLVLAATTIALIAESTWLRLVLATSFALTLLARLLPGLLPQITTLAMLFAYNLLVTAAMVRAVFGAGEVNHHRIAGAVFVYLNIALLFALAYAALMDVVPDALSGFPTTTSSHASEMIHFSFITLTAIGDGHLSPHSPFARSLADLETIIGQLFPAILLSRLVGLHISRTRLQN